MLLILAYRLLIRTGFILRVLRTIGGLNRYGEEATHHRRVQLCAELKIFSCIPWRLATNRFARNVGRH